MVMMEWHLCLTENSSALFVLCGGCIEPPPNFQSRMLFFRSLKIVQHTKFVVFVVFVVFSVYSMFRSFRNWVVPVYLFEYCMITLKIWYLSFDIVSVICKFHNLRNSFQIPFYVVPPIAFSFREQKLYTPFIIEWHLCHID